MDGPQVNREDHPQGSPNESRSEPRWSEDQNHPNKEDNRRWGNRAAWAPVVDAAHKENEKRDWVAQAEREDRCPVCGCPGAQRCRENDSCAEAMMAEHARARAVEGLPSPPAGAMVLTPERREQLGL